MFGFSFFTRRPIPIFVLGSGRSGTHLLGRVFSNRSDTTAFIEDKRFFKMVSHYVTGYNQRDYSLKGIINNYKRHFANVKTEFILEKTHPNIWLVESLAEAFPKAKFVGIHRGVMATVNSMLQHPDIMMWYERLDLTKPNLFLGINASNVQQFASWPPEVKCACRVIEHRKRLMDLEAKFPNRVMVISYNEFYDDLPELMNRLGHFLNYKKPLHAEPLHADGLDKWQHELSSQQIQHLTEFLENENLRHWM